MKKIGITTTVPIEVLYAAGYQVVDLNNLFIVSKEYERYIEFAERDGFPKSMCAWIKGIYGACILNEIHEVVAVVEGDCSNTKALGELLSTHGIMLHPFSYPTAHTIEEVKKSLDEFMVHFGVSYEQVEEERQKLMTVRKLAKEIDRRTYEQNQVTGFENHILQLCMSDFDGNDTAYEAMLQNKLEEIKVRQPLKEQVRLAYIGVPPMTGDLFEFVEKQQCRIVYNEVQREFAFPKSEHQTNIYEQYYDYTYPYDVHTRLKEIKKQIELRQIDGIIHYTQAFCHRALNHLVFQKEIELPIIQIEGDKINKLDARTKLRLEAFVDMLRDLKDAKK